MSAVQDGRLVRGDRTRRAILDRAVDIASLEGLEGLTIGRLATELEISKSGLFAHFGSKEELQLATIDAAAQLYVERILQPALKAPKGLPRAWKLCDRWLDFFRRADLPGLCFFLAVETEFDSRPGRIRDHLSELRLEWGKVYRRAFSDARTMGHLHRDVDVDQLYFEIDALIHRAVLDKQLHADAHALRRARTGILSRLRAAATDPAMLPSR